MQTRFRSLSIIFSFLFSITLIAQDFNSFEYRTVGPERGGRVTTVTGTPILPGTFYLGASGINLELTNKDYSRVKLLKLQTGIHLYLNEITSITPSILVNYGEYFGPDLYLGLNIRKKGVAINLGYQSESSRLFLGNEYENDRMRVSYTYSHEVYSIATVSNRITNHSILLAYKLINKKRVMFKT